MSGETKVFQGADGIHLTADVHGDPANPPVVFLHGGGQTRHSWGDAAERFAAEGFYALTVDLRGHSDSGWAPDGNYQIEGFVADLRALLTQLPNAGSPTAKLPALVGASLGGVTSLLAVGTAEKPIASALVLVDVVPKINPAGAQRIGNFMTGNPDGFATIEAAADAVSAYMPHRPRPKDISGLKKNLRLHDNGRYYWHWDPKFIIRKADISPLQARTSMDDAARNVRIPTLLVKGSLSEIVDEAGVEEFRQMIPAGEVVDIKGAGHMVAGDDNNAFDTAALEFLKRHRQ
jgi:pimeloyl-ACP methyl ester carboxylesterase